MTRAYGEAFDRPAARAALEVQEILGAWAAHGLLSGGPAEPPTGPPPATAAAGPRAAPAAAVRRYRMLGTVFELRCPARGIADSLDRVLPHLAVDADPADVRVDIAAGADGFEVLVDGSLREQALRPEELTPQVKAVLLMTAVNRHGFAAYLHAAVLRIEDSLLLLPGAAGSGKTCLCLALCRNGLAYHSDEAALLASGTLRVRAVPLSACVKEGAWPIVEPLYPQLASLDVHHRIDGKVVKYLPPPVTPGDPALDLDWPVRWVTFPRYAPAAATALRPLRRSEALRRLLQECNAWRLELTAETVERLIGWITGIDCYELEYSSLDDATAAVLSVCRPTG
jgi:hypothetical protein